MAEPVTPTGTASGGQSLRRLVPRIFSRAPSRDALEELMRTVRTHHPKGDIAIIERAYRVAAKAHASQKRQ